jgi:hypothetical protein
MTVFDKEVRSARMSPRYNSARYAHNIYYVKLYNLGPVIRISERPQPTYACQQL